MKEKIKQIIEGKDEYKALWDVGKAKDAGLLEDITWPEIAEVFNKQYREDETCYYDSSAYRKKYRNYIDAYEQLFSKENFTKKQNAEYEAQKRELQKLKIQIQTEKLENNKWLREYARDELIAEHICSAIKELKSLDIPKCRNISAKPKSAILGFGDEHFGTEFTIYGLYGEVINSYSPEIFEQRMWDLFYKVLEIVEKEDIELLHIFALGDFTDGVLRCSQLMKLRYGVVEGTVKYADFISTWLNELSKHVNIRYQMTFGNHSELRMLNQPKGTFKDENTGLFVREMIKTRLENNPNFEMIINPTGLIFDQVAGLNVLAIHGEVKNMERAMKDFSSTYNTDISILIGGHMHHYKAEVVGVNREVVNVPSIIGIDDYSMSLNKTSNPGATLLMVEQDAGISVEYKIKL